MIKVELAIETLNDLLKIAKQRLQTKLHEYEEIARITGSYHTSCTLGVGNLEQEVQSLELAIDTLKLLPPS